MRTSIKQYIRNKDNHKVGVMIALLVAGGEVSIGVSRAREDSWKMGPFGPYKEEGDKFDKDRGTQIAAGRARKKKPLGTCYDPFISAQILKFVERAHKYFKRDEVV